MTPDLAATLADANARTGGPLFYLDTNILVDIARPRRDPSSLDFVEECLARSWRRITSTFAVMEALDVEQMNRWAKIETRKGESFDQLLSRHREPKHRERALDPRTFRDVHSKLTRALEKLVEQFQPEAGVWEDAIRIAIDTASSASDCIHVAAARSRECDVLVTRDSQLKRSARDEVAVARPDEILAWLRKSEPAE